MNYIPFFPGTPIEFIFFNISVNEICIWLHYERSDMEILFKGLNTKKRMLPNIENQSAFRNHADSNTKEKRKKGEDTIKF